MLFCHHHPNKTKEKDPLASKPPIGARSKGQKGPARSFLSDQYCINSLKHRPQSEVQLHPNFNLKLLSMHTY